MENCSGWNMMIRNPRRGKRYTFCKLFVLVWNPSVSVFMKGCDNSTVVTSTLIESTGKKEAKRKQKQGHKKVQKNTSIFSRFHSKYTLPLALSRCLFSETNASEENGVVDLLSKGLLCITWYFSCWSCIWDWFTSIIWCDVGNLQIDTIGRLDEAHASVFSQEDFAGRNDSLGLLPNYHRWAWKRLLIPLQNSIKMSANCIDHNGQLEAKANSWPLLPSN